MTASTICLLTWAKEPHLWVSAKSTKYAEITITLLLINIINPPSSTSLPEREFLLALEEKISRLYRFCPKTKHQVPAHMKMLWSSLPRTTIPWEAGMAFLKYSKKIKVQVQEIVNFYSSYRRVMRGYGQGNVRRLPKEEPPELFHQARA